MSEINPQTGEPYTDTIQENIQLLYLSYPEGADEVHLRKVHTLIEKGAILQREMNTRKEQLESIKTQVWVMVDQGYLPKGKYATTSNAILTVTKADEYESVRSTEVFEYLMTNQVKYEFNDLFTVGFTKLKDLIGKKAESFRKLLNTKTIKLSFK